MKEARVEIDLTLVDRLAAELTRRSARVATAESCTGGWIAKTLTDAAGGSAWFEYGFVTYGNNAKQNMLGVPAGVLETYGAVSQETAEAMVGGALEAAGADYSLAVTGIAGPDGGSPEKPVGTVWIAWAGPNGQVVSELFHFDGDRDQVRRQSVSAALSGLLRNLDAMTN